MLRLSRVGWNNVIIISVMSFILLINTVFKENGDQGDSLAGEQAILTDNAVILTLTFHQNAVVERVGKSWRSTMENLSEHELEQMMMAWQQRSGQIMATAPEVDSQMALTVSAELANVSSAITLELYATDSELLIFNHGYQQWLSLPLPIFSQLVPDAVFSSM